ncbi:MAG: hypothetical protein WCE68_05650 [Anaerolineales bacterium]
MSPTRLPLILAGEHLKQLSVRSAWFSVTARPAKTFLRSSPFLDPSSSFYAMDLIPAFVTTCPVPNPQSLFIIHQFSHAPICSSSVPQEQIPSSPILNHHSTFIIHHSTILLFVSPSFLGTNISSAEVQEFLPIYRSLITDNSFLVTHYSLRVTHSPKA